MLIIKNIDSILSSMATMKAEEKGKGNNTANVSNERWSGAISNLTETTANLESLQKLLLKKAVFVDGDSFARAQNLLLMGV
ncbi:hypothetical protein AKJ16_DCAP15755 [Drosera capensis]